jgi:hypothetical protein
MLHAALQSAQIELGCRAARKAHADHAGFRQNLELAIGDVGRRRRHAAQALGRACERMQHEFIHETILKRLRDHAVRQAERFLQRQQIIEG